MKSAGELLKDRIELLKPKKVTPIPKKQIISLFSKKLTKLKGDPLDRWRAVAGLIRMLNKTEATRIYNECLESKDFEKSFWSNIKTLNKYRKKPRQKKLL